LKHAVIIGGGIAGLAAAYRLERRGRGIVAYTLIESLSRLGGKITSAHQNGFLVEGGPDSFYWQKPGGLDVCRDLGLEDQLLGLKTASHQALIWSRGRLRPLPLSPVRIAPLLRSSLISWPGKLRMAADFFIPPRSNDDDFADESMADFVRRRLGREALHRIADPLLAGIHAGDPKTLSLKSTFPRLQELERKHGSLLRAALALRKQNRKPAAPPPVSPLATLRGGLQQLVDALVFKLDPRALHLNCGIHAVLRKADHYEVLLDGNSSVRADAIIFATPAHVTADLVENIAPRLASKLREIRYVSTATVSLGFRRSDMSNGMNGSGYLVPFQEQRSVLGCTWCSNKFEGRAPDNHVLMRLFIGGARAERLAEQPDHRLLELARDELRATMRIHAAPLVERVYRWPKAIPQYEVGHESRLEQVDRLISEYPGLHLAGAAYRGIGIPDCIQSGNRAADALLDHITEREKPELPHRPRLEEPYDCRR